MFTRLLIALLVLLANIASSQLDDVFTRSANLIDPHRDGFLLDYEGFSSQLSEVHRILRTLEAGDELTDENSLAYHVLAYNMYSISKIAENYPLQSIKQIPDFFDSELIINNKSYTLRSLESHLVDIYDHGAIHFLLNSGTMDSPPLPIHSLIKSDTTYLESVLKSVLNNRLYAYVNLPNNQINLSSIFDWHREDFGGIQRIIDLIESYNTINLEECNLKFDVYDWTLNDSKNGQRTRYYPTRLLNQGEVEFKIFGNYYTQVDPNSGRGFAIRSSVFNQIISLTLGTNRNINWGLALKLRSVNIQPNRTLGSFFGGVHFINERKSINGGIEGYRRFGLTGVGPQIKYRPQLNFRGKSLIVHTLIIPIGKDLEGNGSQGFLDWSGFSLYNQFLYENDITSKTNLFFDFGLHLENLDQRIFKQEGGYVSLSTPVTAIYHYYPAPKWTLYGLANVIPRVTFSNFSKVDASFEPLGQIGGGIRKFISKTIELELLITQVFGGSLQRKAQTVNLGIRYNY